MQKAVWQKAIEASADPTRAQSYLNQFKALRGGQIIKGMSTEQFRILLSLFSGSQGLSELLIAHPEWIELFKSDALQNARQAQGLRRDVQSWLRPGLETRDYANAFAKLRLFKQREMLRIAARDLARLGTVTEITREISDVADVCLEAAHRLCLKQLTERFGQPYHQDADGRWQSTASCVLGMGKLGGQELNYSSDVDLLFVYAEEGHVFSETPRRAKLTGKGLSNHQFFVRLAEAFVGEIGRMAPEGALYRIDLRLRPEGNAGPLARSLGSYETYYAQWGQTWERMMLIKTRLVAGDASLGSDFLEMIQPFRYPRAVSERIIQEVVVMKQRTETEVVKSGEIERNVKLGRGGIREVEFVAQTLQVLHGGRVPFLQDAQTLSALQKLARYRLLAGSEAKSLSEAYCFLRDVEHRLQMENNLQTHTIPTDRKSRERLAKLMGFEELAEFETAKQQHNHNVRAIYQSLLKTDDAEPGRALPDIDTSEEAWKELLREHRFREPERAVRMIRELIRGPGYVHVSPRTSELALQLLPRFLDLCSEERFTEDSSAQESSPLSDPDRVLARLDSFIAAYGSRALLYETWTSNPSLFRLLLLLFDRSEFLAEIAIRTPDLVDELELSGRLRRRKSAEEILHDLRHGLSDNDQRLWLRRYHQAELMRIGLRDILGLADFEQNLIELSALADACLQYALEVVLQKYRLKTSPMAIIGLGKLGGAELNYGSDLDITFVADAKPRNLPQLQRLAGEVMDLLSSPTELGVAFLTDARLRPDGEKGLLVNTLPAYEEYYRQRAQLWEIQSLSRTRAIAGNQEIGERFQHLAAALTNFRDPEQPVVAYTPNWKEEIMKMRRRIEKERTPAGRQELAIKTGAGGLMDAEFIAQALCLANGWHEPHTLDALLRAREARALDPADAETLIGNYRKLRRIEGILRRWSFAGETLLPDDPAPLYRVAVRCGFPDAGTFMNKVAEYRAAIRSVYLKVMS